MATRRELTSEIERYRQAESLLRLGLRVPVVCEMTRLSHWFLRKLALEVSGEAPAKGQVPNSELWYLRGRNNLHASLFLALYRPLQQAAGADFSPAELLIVAFQRYRDIIAAAGLPEILTPDRAWWLLKSVRIPSLKRIHCEQCGGRFLMHQEDLPGPWRCVCCLVRAPLPAGTAPEHGLAPCAPSSRTLAGKALPPGLLAGRARAIRPD